MNANWLPDKDDYRRPVDRPARLTTRGENLRDALFVAISLALAVVAIAVFYAVMILCIWLGAYHPAGARKIITGVLLGGTVVYLVGRYGGRRSR
jgi:hypothetical protein